MRTVKKSEARTLVAAVIEQCCSGKDAAKSAGEVMQLLHSIAVDISRSAVKRHLESLLADGKIASIQKTFVRNGREVRGAAYYQP